MSRRTPNHGAPLLMEQPDIDAHATMHEEGAGHDILHAADRPVEPLHRELSVSIKASLSELCLSQSKSRWAPHSDAVKTIFQQHKFNSLGGNVEAQGDLRSVVLHKLSLTSVKSTFPIAVGVDITGADPGTYSGTGAAFGTVVHPNVSFGSMNHVLQTDDVDAAYEFARKFPGYTAENLSTRGVHEVQQRRFCMLAQDHPVVEAISENQEKLQMGEISMMP